MAWDDSFDCYGKATLYVPSISMDKYQTTAPWQQFYNIEALYSNVPCDVNGDWEISIADVNLVIDIIMGGYVPQDIRERADVNWDGEINLADVNSLIDLILY